MNHIYNVRFNARNGQWVVTSELAKSAGKGKNNTRKLKMASAFVLSSLLLSTGMAQTPPIDYTDSVDIGNAPSGIQGDGYLSMDGKRIEFASGGYGIRAQNSFTGKIEVNLNNTDIYTAQTGVYIDKRTAGVNGDVIVDLKKTTVVNTWGDADGVYVGAKGIGNVNITTDIASIIDLKGSGSSFGIAIQTADSGDITGNFLVDNSATITTANSNSGNSGLFLQAAIKIDGDVTYINRGHMDIGGNSHGIDLSLRNVVTKNINAENYGTIISHNVNSAGILIDAAARAATEVQGDINIKNSGSMSGGGYGILLKGLQNATNTVNIDLLPSIKSDIQSNITSNIGIQADLLSNNNITLHAGSAINAKNTAIHLRDIGAATSTVVLKNAGSLNAESDKLITTATIGSKGKYSFDLTNSGDMTGYMVFDGTVPLKLLNSGTWTVQDRTSADNRAIVTFTNNATNTVHNTGTINFNAQRADLVNSKNFKNSGILDLTTYTPSHTDVYIGSQTDANTFIADSGTVKFGLHESANPDDLNGIRSDRLYLQQVETGSKATSLRFAVPQQLVAKTTDAILVINVEDKAASATDAFTLGHDVFVGNDQYVLRQDDGNWYLTPGMPWNAMGTSNNNQQLYRADAGLGMAARQSVVDSMVPGLVSNGLAPNGVTGSGFLRSSLRLTTLGQKSNALWAFATGNHSHGTAQSHQLKFHSDTYTLQVGADRGFAVDNAWLELGGMVFTNKSKHTSINRITGSSAKGDTDGYGFGLYGTYYFTADDKLSPYLDGFAIFGRYKNTNKTRGNASYDYKSNAFSFTLSGGYPFQVSSSVILEPQAQVTYVDYKSKSHQDHNGYDVRFKTDGKFVYRAGAYMLFNIENENFQPYAAMNLWHDDTRSNIAYGKKSDYLNSDKRGAYFEAKAGFQAKATENFVYWGEVSGKIGKRDYRDVGIAVGIKYLW